MYKQFTIILLYTFATVIKSSRILAVFPAPSISHQILFRPLTQELASRGHKVTVITTDRAFPKEQCPENLTEIDVHDISYNTFGKTFIDQISGRNDIIVEHMYNIDYINAKVVAEQLKTEEIQNLINNQSTKFDLLLIELCSRSALIYSYIFNVPVIQVSSFGIWIGLDEVIGTITHPILYPNLVHQRLYNLSLWEKIYEFYKHELIKKGASDLKATEQEMLQRILNSDVPNYDVLKYNVDMVSVNVHPLWIDNQPLPINVISMSGIHKKSQKELPQELSEYLNSSKQGVIYMSFGTNAPSSQLPTEIIQIFIRVFSRLPYDVLWKWEKDELPGKPQNVKIAKWFPQSDILNHPKIKLFITQGGIQSTEESINSCVPLIGIPLLIDQWYNVQKIRHHKIGLQLDINTLDDDQLYKAIQTVLTDKSFKENIVRLRSLLNDQPQSALDRTVWWIEYVLRHGGAKHLRVPAANMPWMEYYDIDILLLFLFSIIIIIILIIFALFKK